MWKRFLICFFIGISILTIGSTGYASAPANKSKVELKVDGKTYQEKGSGKNAYSKEDKIALINGKAPARTPIKIKIYGTTDLTKKNFNLNKLPSDQDYIEIFNETIRSGNMGFFQKKLDLVLGINKIILDFSIDGESPKEIIIYVYDKAPTLTEIILNTK